MTSYHFYCIFFVRSESLDPAYIQEEAVTQGHGYQEVGIIGGYLEDAFTVLKHISVKKFLA